MVKKIIQENVIGTYSTKEMLDYYKKVGLWKAEKILFKKYFVKKHANLLDVGCGGGRTTIPLVKMGFKVTALDITPKLVEITKNNLKKFNLEATVKTGDATKMNYKSNLFDYALFSFNGIEAIPNKSQRLNALREIHRVLKPSGIFIFTTNTQSYFKGKKYFFFLRESLKFYLSKIFNFQNKYSRINEFEYGDCFLNFNPPMFIHFSNPKKVKSNLHRLGFDLLFSEHREVIEDKENPNLTKDIFYVCKKG
jgi:ubiquinone/menaquinone biosynthesis C-methylase UbiE